MGTLAEEEDILGQEGDVDSQHAVVEEDTIVDMIVDAVVDTIVDAVLGVAKVVHDDEDMRSEHSARVDN